MEGVRSSTEMLIYIIYNGDKDERSRQKLEHTLVVQLRYHLRYVL